MKEASFPEKYMKKLNTLAQGFTDAVDTADVDEIKKKLLTAEKNVYEIENEKEANLKLSELKEKMKEITAPYRDARAVETAKVKYCVFSLQQRGVKI